MAKPSSLLLALALATALPVLGQIHEPEEALKAHQVHALFERIDHDKDGKVTIKELMDFSHVMSKADAEQDAEEAIEDMDKSKDGKLSLDEYLEAFDNREDIAKEPDQDKYERHRATETAKFKALDGDGDSLLELKEVAALLFPGASGGVLEASVKATMETMDLDDDGYLSRKEFSGSVETGDRSQEAEDDGEQEEWAQAHEFEILDKDDNGRLDAGEVSAWLSGVSQTEAELLELIEIADKDGDMALSLAELQNAREEVVDTDAQTHLMFWALHHEL